MSGTRPGTEQLHDAGKVPAGLEACLRRSFLGRSPDPAGLLEQPAHAEPGPAGDPAALAAGASRGDLEQDRLFCRRYYEFFNTNPYLANFLIGGLVRLEDERAAGPDFPPGTTGTFRQSLGRAFASLGDQLFWLGIQRPR